MSDSNASFPNYTETTLDPGWSFLVAAIVACFLLFATLPCLVSLGSRYERRKVISTSKSASDTSDEDDDDADKNSDKGSVLIDASKYRSSGNDDRQTMCGDGIPINAMNTTGHSYEEPTERISFEDHRIAMTTDSDRMNRKNEQESSENISDDAVSVSSTRGAGLGNLFDWICCVVESVSFEK